jgi:hypothetical protein
MGKDGVVPPLYEEDVIEAEYSHVPRVTEELDALPKRPKVVSQKKHGKAGSGNQKVATTEPRKNRQQSEAPADTAKLAMKVIKPLRRALSPDPVPGQEEEEPEDEDDESDEEDSEEDEDEDKEKPGSEPESPDPPPPSKATPRKVAPGRTSPKVVDLVSEDDEETADVRRHNIGLGRSTQNVSTGSRVPAGTVKAVRGGASTATPFPLDTEDDNMVASTSSAKSGPIDRTIPKVFVPGTQSTHDSSELSSPPPSQPPSSPMEIDEPSPLPVRKRTIPKLNVISATPSTQGTTGTQESAAGTSEHGLLTQEYRDATAPTQASVLPASRSIANPRGVKNVAQKAPETLRVPPVSHNSAGPSTSTLPPKSDSVDASRRQSAPPDSPPTHRVTRSHARSSSAISGEHVCSNISIIWCVFVSKTKW